MTSSQECRDSINSSHYCGQIRDKKQLREGRDHIGSWFESLHHGGKVWQLITLHPRSGSRKAMSRDAQLALSFLFSPGPQPMAWCHPDLSEPDLETFSQACPEVCLLDDSRSCQVINQY